jgi:hypothetical protein
MFSFDFFFLLFLSYDKKEKKKEKKEKNYPSIDVKEQTKKNVFDSSFFIEVDHNRSN